MKALCKQTMAFILMILLACGVCGESFSPVSLYASCPKCGSYKTRLVSGQEFRLTSLIVETDK